ncbi:isoflavone reductase family protein [Melanomma pulvis-pyrius CBS 109.77]|uniref:Isoflavone reductase family protein n=1 Tax=Melanomma pulvis-pyrius CBS 109.77 TaxID=1314802 RepID=A0A6A6XYV8_9PLEO|nr:isoflavone reductase family protein [Melanomma pulvis-pyrius CBS 109.77]
MSIQNVALIGASGTLGPSILAALKTSPYTPFVLNRASSKSTYPSTNVITVPDDLNIPALTALFNDHAIDALVLAIAGSHVETQKKLIDAAFAARVQLVIPAEFGSCDSDDDATNALLPLMAGKKRVREYLQSLESKERGEGKPNLAWTSLVTGHFFDWGLEHNLLCIDVQRKIAHLLDGGDIKFSGSNLSFIARAVVAILALPDAARNKLLYVHSHHVTQLELLAALEKVMGEKFERLQESSKEELAEARPKMLKGDPEATEEVVAVHGVVASDWAGKSTFANQLLGLEEEDLEEVVARVVQKMKGKATSN